MCPLARALFKVLLSARIPDGKLSGTNLQSEIGSLTRLADVLKRKVNKRCARACACMSACPPCLCVDLLAVTCVFCDGFFSRVSGVFVSLSPSLRP